MLEDGDRAECLRKSGKKIIVVDLNPLSRSAKMGSITIVDNVVRCIPLIKKEIVKIKGCKRKKGKKEKASCVKEAGKNFENKKNLKKAVAFIRKNI